MHWAIHLALTSGYGPKKDKRTGSKTSPLRTPRIVRMARTAKKYLEKKNRTVTITKVESASLHGCKICSKSKPQVNKSHNTERLVKSHFKFSIRLDFFFQPFDFEDYIPSPKVLAHKGKEKN